MPLLVRGRDPSTGAAGADLVVAHDRLAELLPQADMVALTCPLTPRTEGLIGEHALAAMKTDTRTTAVVIEVDKEMRVPGYESWWDVPISEVSGLESIRAARARYEEAVKKERHHEMAAGAR